MEEKNIDDYQLQLELDIFEGPLDLLLHLINQLEIDIYDIPIAKITKQYLNYLETMKNNQIDLAGEYFVMAASLMRIKSEMLVPRNENQVEMDDIEEYELEDPRQSLVDLLLEYQQIKEVVPKFEERQIDRADFFGKDPSDLSKYQEKIELENQGLKIEDLTKIFYQVLERHRLDTPQPTTIESEEMTVPEKMGDILNSLSKAPTQRLNFLELLKAGNRKEIVVNFLAILELLKANQISVRQKINTTDFSISLID